MSCRISIQQGYSTNIWNGNRFTANFLYGKSAQGFLIFSGFNLLTHHSFQCPRSKIGHKYIMRHVNVFVKCNSLVSIFVTYYKIHTYVIRYWIVNMEMVFILWDGYLCQLVRLPDFPIVLSWNSKNWYLLKFCLLPWVPLSWDIRCCQCWPEETLVVQSTKDVYRVIYLVKRIIYIWGSLYLFFKETYFKYSCISMTLSLLRSASLINLSMAVLYRKLYQLL